MSCSKWNFALLVILGCIPVVVSQIQQMDESQLLELIRSHKASAQSVSYGLLSFHTDINVVQVATPTKPAEPLNTTELIEQVAKRSAELIVNQTAKATLDLQLKYFTDLLGMKSVGELNQTVLELLTFAIKTKEFVHKYLSPFSSRVKTILYRFGGGDHSFPLCFVLIPATTSLVHWMIGVYCFRSLGYFMSAFGCILSHALNAGAIFALTYLWPIGDTSADGIEQASCGYSLALISSVITFARVHSTLHDKWMDVQKQRTADVLAAAQTRRINSETAARVSDVKTIKELYVKTSLDALTGGFSVQPAPPLLDH